MNEQSPAKPIESAEPTDGIALCLSGGGYRAMLFHTGALVRINEFGLLPHLTRISSVSGGSITAAILGLKWKQLSFNDKKTATNLKEVFVKTVLDVANTTIDRGAVIGGLLLPGSINEMVVSKLNEVAFHDATLQDLPDDGKGIPRFVMNATSVQTGALVRMSKHYLADYRVGTIKNPRIQLAQAVAASSAFPPFLSPAEIDVDPSDFISFGGEDLNKEPYNDTMILTDGGVYDNLGLETAVKSCKILLVSDGGGKMKADPQPAGDWAQHSRRILDIVDNQVRSLRKRQLLDLYNSGRREGTYWGIRTDIKDYQLSDALDVAHEYSLDLADTPTRLKKLTSDRQTKIMNWGYAVCDAAMRKHAGKLLTNPPERKYPF